MFSGETYYRVDAQGRVPIPPRMRPQFGGVAILTRGFDGCIAVYTVEDWKRRAEQIAQLSETKARNRRMMRQFIARSHEAEIDKQGRVKIPAHLRKYATIEQDVVVAGMPNHLEIWDQARWDEEGELMDANFDQLGETLED